MTYKIDFKTLNMLVSTSKDKLFQLSTPVFVSGKEAERGHLPSMANFESLLMFLNSKGLLTEFVEFDYTNDFSDNDSPELE